MVKITSAASATARGVSPQRIPRSKSHCAFDFVRLYPVTVWPASRSRFVTRPPMAPNPTNPRLAITTSNLAEPDNKKQLAFMIDRSSCVFANLSQVSTHGSTCSFRVATDNAFEDASVMDLPALGTACNSKDLFALFTQQVHNRVYKDQNKCALGSLR